MKNTSGDIKMDFKLQESKRSVTVNGMVIEQHFIYT